ncbi:hypothetical protein MPER_12684 [Moniliophthora perniciosa FA553]|nr:hypothetical protein MPER_12684 [Moniliophthora perniciosa FA553]
MAKRKRGPRAGILSTSKPFDVPEDPEVVRKILIDLANFARSLDRQLAETQGAGVDAALDNVRPSTSPKFTYQQEPPEIKDSIESLTEDFQKMLVDVHWQTHYGKSSNNWFIQITLDAKRDELDEGAFAAAWTKYKRPELWKVLPWQRTIESSVYPHLEFPERDLLDGLITTYFEDLNPFFPLLHRPTFEASVAEQLHRRDRSFGLVVLARGVEMVPPNSSLHSKGLHRRKPKSQKPTVEHELWKRAFWILVSTDLVASVVQGRPRATTPDDFDAELPSECDDEFWESTDAELAFIQPEGKPSTTAFFLSLLKLVEILGFAERTVVSSLAY